MGGDCSVAESLRLFRLGDLCAVSDAGWGTRLGRFGGVCASGLRSSVGVGGGCLLDATSGALLDGDCALGTFGGSLAAYVCLVWDLGAAL